MFRLADRRNVARAGIMLPFSPCPLYGITEHGDVIRLDTGLPLLPAPRSKRGYLGVSLWQGGKGRTWFVHQMVAIAFHGPRPSRKHDAAHRDGNKLNNHRDNIKWCTRSE